MTEIGERGINLSGGQNLRAQPRTKYINPQFSIATNDSMHSLVKLSSIIYALSVYLHSSYFSDFYSREEVVTI